MTLCWTGKVQCSFAQVQTQVESDAQTEVVGGGLWSSVVSAYKSGLSCCMALQVQATRALLRVLQQLPSLRSMWGMHNAEPIQALIESKEPDVRWLANECLALLAKLVSCYSPLCLFGKRRRHPFSW